MCTGRASLVDTANDVCWIIALSVFSGRATLYFSSTYEQVMSLAQDKDSYYKIVARKVDRSDTEPIREYKNANKGCNGIVLS
ncbi:MAG: hypothetical protein II045_02325, partial [Oscillospiraceae bacterium]|nr:hypothetical protein [Oscillospiraceae bacterium]